MNKILSLCLLLFMFSSVSAWANEKPVLIMFNSPYCGYCELFFREVGEENYNASKEGKMFPLKILDVTVQDDLSWYYGARQVHAIGRVEGTPTFVLFYKNKEVGRVRGFAGKDWFYKKLDEQIKKFNENMR